MIDEESDLRERFAQLRAEDRPGVPRFHSQPRARRRPAVWRVIAATAVLVLAFLITTIRSHPTKTRFSSSDRAVVRSMAEWHPPTDFLLRTPGSEILTTTPRIPDLKGLPR